MDKIDNTDLNDLLNKAIETKPDFVEPPPLFLPTDCNEFRYIPPFYARIWFVFLLGFLIGLAVKHFVCGAI